MHAVSETCRSLIPTTFKPQSPKAQRQMWKTLKRFPANVLIAAVRFYQITISPLLGPTCRFQPTCSAYFIESINKYGVVLGGAKGVWRILRCHPLNKGGYDPP